MSSLSRPSVAEAMDTESLLQRVSEGDTAALDQLLAEHRDYLRRLLQLQMEPELRARVDPSDVIQETQLTASRRIEAFLTTRPTSFKLWLRGTAIDRLIDARRKHIVAHKRSVRREVSLPEASSLALAQSVFVARPSAAIERRELVQRTNQAMEQLSEADRSVLLLRHVEDLSLGEIGEVLEISPDAARKRYGRAILRLRAVLIRSGVLSSP